jgi:hypothetical protein
MMVAIIRPEGPEHENHAPSRWVPGEVRSVTAGKWENKAQTRIAGWPWRMSLDLQYLMATGKGVPCKWSDLHSVGRLFLGYMIPSLRYRIAF